MMTKYQTRNYISRPANKSYSSSRKTRRTSNYPRTSSPIRSESNKLKIIVLGGLEEVGRNMTLLEYDREIIIIDMGLQFPEEDMLGIDYIIPNTDYLVGKEDWIKGIIITHGHYDHIGAIPHLLGKVKNPPMFMGRLTAGLVEKKIKEQPQCPKAAITIIEENKTIQLGKNFNIEFLRMNHSIPDCFAPIIHTPLGTIMHTGDFKIDYSPVNDKPADLQRIAQFGSQGILMLMSDSTDSTHPGYQISESSIGDEMSRLFEKIEGRIIICTFASQISRIQEIFSLAEKFGRRIYVQGRSMNDNIEIAKQIGYMKFNPQTIIQENEIRHMPDSKTIVLGTGAQGENNAFLMRVVNNEHRTIHLKPGDTVIFSSSVIPGNERSIQNLKDQIARQGGRVIHYEMLDVHAGGHAKQEDLKLMMRLLKPKYFMPIEGSHYMLQAHAELAQQVGIPTDKIFVPDNGQITTFEQRGHEIIGELTKEKVVTDYVMVDGLGVGDVSDIVLRDRKTMAEDGMIVVIATIDSKTGDPIGNPDIISRGFIYMKDNKDLIQDTRMRVKKIIKETDPLLLTSTRGLGEDDQLKNKIRADVSQFLFNKTKRRPMVLPVVIKV
ncbi:MAG: ribonuclease J [Candidatus Pacebacteria bacterium]|nr:ribonuclease J [Candidatus Paceibacterota bacterium]